jgi:hypothetical protein
MKQLLGQQQAAGYRHANRACPNMLQEQSTQLPLA